MQREMLPRSHRWRWEILEIYNSSFGNNNPREDFESVSQLNQLSQINSTKTIIKKFVSKGNFCIVIDKSEQLNKVSQKSCKKL